MRLISKPKKCPRCNKNSLMQTYEDFYYDDSETVIIGYTCMNCHCKFEEDSK